MPNINKGINFFCVYVKTKKKFDKYTKVNRIRNKYVLDVRKMKEEEGVSSEDDLMYIKILIFNKIQRALERGRDIYYIPDFNDEFSIKKLMNLRKVLGEDSNFNILLFYDEFEKNEDIRSEALNNLTLFSNSQIIRDY